MNENTKPSALFFASGFVIVAVSLLIIGIAIRHAERDIASTQTQEKITETHTESEVSEKDALPEDSSVVSTPANVEGGMLPSNTELISDLHREAEASAKSEVGPSSLALTEEQIRFIEENNLIAQ